MALIEFETSGFAYAGSRMQARRSVLRVFAGRFTIAFLIASAAMGGGVLAVNTVIAGKLGKVSRIDVHTAAGTSEGGNYLLIGSDTRQFVADASDSQQFGSTKDNGGQRSDTMMVAHIDPASKQTIIVSFPRDLWVTIPGVGKSKINAAFNSGPDKVIATLKQNFGVDINHYVEVDFKSFQGVVDAAGRVSVYIPYPARDDKTGLYVPFPGCVQLDGAASLAYVRSRALEYYSSVKQRWISADAVPDIDRIARQQDFIRRMASLAVSKSLGDPLVANDIADRIVSHLTVDQGLSKSDMLSLVDAFRSIDPNNTAALSFETLPWTEGPQQGGQSVLYPADPAWRAMVARLTQFGGSSSAASTATTIRTVVPGTVTLQVLNGSGRSGIATTTLASLTSLGFKGSIAGNDSRGTVAATEVRYKTGSLDKAHTVAAYLSPSPKLVEDSTLTNVDVSVVVGTDFKAVAAPTTGSATTASSGAAGSGTTATSNGTSSGSGGSTSSASGSPSTSQFGPAAAHTDAC